MIPKQSKMKGCPGEKVQHKYQDYALKTSIAHENLEHAIGPGGDPPFPVKLHYALKELTSDNMNHIISWQPHGRCFVVRQQKNFAEQVLPLYFRQSKFSSFQRQLNLYGFKRLTQGPDKGGYYHELFLRGMPELAARITRTTVKNKGPRKAASPGTEPNLYSYSPLPCDAKKEAKESKAFFPAPATSAPMPASPVLSAINVPDLSTPPVSKAPFMVTPIASLCNRAPANSAPTLLGLYASQLARNIAQPATIISSTPLASRLPLMPTPGVLPPQRRGVLAQRRVFTTSHNQASLRTALNMTLQSLSGYQAR